MVQNPRPVCRTNELIGLHKLIGLIDLIGLIALIDLIGLINPYNLINCCPCCCRRPCRCPPPHCPPPRRRHHHEADALDVLDVHTKTPGLYQVPKLRNLNFNFLDILEGGTDGVTYTIRWSRIKMKKSKNFQCPH